MDSGFSHAIRIRENIGCDRVDASDHPPLHPLHAGDSYAYANGVLAYYANGYAYVHVDASTPPTCVPCHAWGTIHAVATSVGLSDTEASLLCEACEAYGVTR